MAQVIKSIIDGEIVCMDLQGKPRFYDLMFRRGTPCFAAFDLVWKDAEDLRQWPLTRRKEMLRKLIPDGASHLLDVDPVLEHGRELYQRVCEMDLEGIV